MELIGQAQTIIFNQSHKRNEVEKNLSKILSSFLIDNYLDILKSKVVTDLKKYHPKAVPQQFRIEVPVFMITEREGRVMFRITKEANDNKKISFEYGFQIQASGDITFSALISITENN